MGAADRDKTAHRLTLALAESATADDHLGGAARSYVMCLECWLDVDNLNQPTAGQSFGRQRVRVSPELCSLIASCLSLQVCPMLHVRVRPCVFGGLLFCSPCVHCHCVHVHVVFLF